MFILSIAIIVPLNDYTRAAGDPDQIEVTDVRSTFNERRWVRSNRTRSVLTLIAFGCLCWALSNSVDRLPPSRDVYSRGMEPLVELARLRGGLVVSPAKSGVFLSGALRWAKD